MINKMQLKGLICRVLRDLGLYSDSAVNLLMGTAAQESRLGTYIHQLGGGPALGIFQMEPDTEKDIWINYISYRKPLEGRIADTTGRRGPGPWLELDLAYQIAMARIHYLRVPESLPDPDDIAALAQYWKLYYNTSLGDGSEDEFVANYNRYVA